MNFNLRPSLLANTPQSLTSAVGAVGLFLATQNAEAAAPVPAFNEFQHVQCVPECDFDKSYLENNLSKRDYPFYTVMYSKENNTDINPEVQLEKIVDTWSQNERFDSNYSTVLVIDQQDRKMSMLPGDKFRNKFKYEHLIENQIFQRDFLPHVKSNKPDWTLAIEDYTASFDGYYHDLAGYKYIDRLNQDDKEFRTMMGIAGLFFIGAGVIAYLAAKNKIGGGGSGGDSYYYYHGDSGSSSGGDAGSSSHDF